ncbi:MAG: hypothetical protein M3552_16455, partial [Planctomycetota bacterium]|nr:hypothetical protein [Planctomycetota bacterium]
MSLFFSSRSVALCAFTGASFIAGFGAMQPDGRSGGPKPEGQFEVVGPNGGPFGVQHDGRSSASASNRAEVGRFKIAAVAGPQG